jgi:hypothetical protein
MNITNTSKHPTPAVTTLVRFAARHVDGDKFKASRDMTVRITHCSRSFRGRCFGVRRILVRVGEAKSFPVEMDGTYCGNGVVHSFETWQEALVGVTAHELMHTDQNLRGDARKRQYRENECERAAKAAVEAYRAQQDSVEAACVVAVARRASVEERVSADRSPASKIEHARSLLKKWEAKKKRAETAIKKLTYRIRYYERKAERPTEETT